MKIHEKWLVEGTSKPQKTSLHPRMTEAKSPVLGRASPYSRMWLTAVEVVDSSDFFFSIENSHGARTLLTISPLPRANSFSSLENLSGVTSRRGWAASETLSPYAGGGSVKSNEKNSGPRILERDKTRFVKLFSCSTLALYNYSRR